MYTLKKSHKLDDVCYDIRGPIMQEAKRLEEEGHQILKLNIGNPAPFGFNAPEEVIQDVIYNLPESQGYSDSKGLFSARKAVMQHCQQRNIEGVEIEDIFLGNGVSELIIMTMQALLDNGDEMLIPAPDYPLWTAAVTLSGGKAVHYICDESADWQPDLADIESKISKKTKGIVLINPNNPTGAVYSKELLESIIEIARKHNLIIYSDEIYDKIVYDDAVHHSIAAMADDILIITFSGLSKSYRAAGFRAGWMIISGAKHKATDYLEGVNMLCSMRLCANVPAQHGIQTSLGGYQSINDLILPKGRLHEQREAFYNGLTSIPGISCVKPKGALYLFPKIDIKKYNIASDRQMVLDFLLKEKVLVVEGTAFNWPKPDHFRAVFLPRLDQIETALEKFERFLKGYTQ